jgi:hypothetical protein
VLDREDLQWSDPVTLRVTDTGNLSRTMREGSRSVVINEWIDRFNGHRLVIKLIDQDGEPEVAFVPHSHSDRQMTLKPDGTNQPGVWSMLVAGASKQNVLEFTVTYCYEIAN